MPKPDGTYYDNDASEFIKIRVTEETNYLVNPFTNEPLREITEEEKENLINSPRLEKVKPTASENPLQFLSKAIDDTVYRNNPESLTSIHGKYAWRYVSHYLSSLKIIKNNSHDND